MPDLPERIAVLIDADNAPASKIDAILSEVATVGKAHVRRAYGDWSGSQLSSWRDILQDFAIAPVQQFAYTAGKNASDIAMVIDAMDLLHTGQAESFALVTSDADFTPLAMRLRQAGATVLGFGEGKTPEAFTNACSRFLYIDRVDGEKIPGERKEGAAMRQDTRLVQMLRTAVDAASQDDGWANLSAVGNQVRNQSSFEARNYGYDKLGQLVEAIGLFQIKRVDNAMFLKRNIQRKLSTQG